MRPSDAEAYLRRDWRAIEDAKLAFWADQATAGSPAARLSSASRWNAYLRSVQPGYPDAADRAEDLAMHVELGRRLRSV